MKALRHFLVFTALCGSALGTTRYVAASAGTFSGGTSCNGQTAITPTTFNSTTLSPGDVTYVCGTITGAANATILTISQSGTSGSPISLLFDTGAIIKAPYCSGTAGCIQFNGRSWITINGQSTGTVENTTNGDGLADQQASIGLYGYQCNNCVVENLTIANIYIAIKNYSSPLGGLMTSMNAIYLSGQNWTISGNTIHDCGWCIYDIYQNGDTNTVVSANYIYNWDHGMMFATGGANACTAPCLLLHDNQFGANINFETSGCTYHLDGLHTFGTTGSSMDGVYIYNNYFFGSLSGACSSGFIFIEGGGSSTPSNLKNLYFWNNVGDATGADSANANGWFGLFSADQSMGVYNNTLLYNNTQDLTVCWSVGGASGGNVVNNLTFEGNVVNGCNVAMSVPQTGALSGTTKIDYNFYGDACFYSNNCFNYLNSFKGSFSGWKTACSCDAHSLTSTYSGALLNSDGSPQSGSPVIKYGANFGSIATGSLATLADDTTKGNTRSPNVRPASGTCSSQGSLPCWDIGAYQFTSGGSASPPTCSVHCAGTYTNSVIVTFVNPNSGTTVMCGAVSPTTPVSDGTGTGCTTGTNIGTGSTANVTISASGTYNVIAGTSTLSDSSVLSEVYTIQFGLSVYNYGASSDTVTSSPSGISCTGSSSGNLCTANFNSTATVTLSHSAAGVDTFTNWAFPGCGVSGTCAVTMSADESVSAVFAPTLPTLPQTFVDNNELTCKAAGNCYTGSPGLSLTPSAYEYQLGASSWITGPPPTCTFATLPYALSFTGLQNFVTAMEACRTLTGVGITLDVPPGTTMVGTSVNGLVIPQTNSTTANAPLIIRSTNHSNLADGVTVCAHGVQDNLSLSTDPGLNNPDCTGLNMYFTIAPTISSGIISGITTLSTNTTTLAAISTTGSQCVPLANGYVAPGVAEIVDTGGNQETVTTISGVNKTGMCGNFTKTHLSGVAVTYNVGAFMLANGTPTNTSNYNDVQYMWTLEAQHTGNSNALTYCNASASTQSPTCGSNIGPDHWLIEDMEARLFAGSTNIGFAVQAAGSTVVTSSVQLPTHNHIRKSWMHADWTSTYTGANAVSAGLDWEGIYVSVVDSQISQIMKPGDEHHAISLQADQVKVNHNWLEGGSIGIFSGGYSGGTGPSIFGWIPLCDGEIRRNRLTWPFSWMGQSPILAGTNPNWHNDFSLVRKNSFEMKGGCRTVVEGNIGEHVDSSGGQGGTLGELDPKNNSSGTGTYYLGTLNNVTMADNIFRHGCQVWNITTSHSGPGGGTAYPPRSIEWLNNLIYDISGTNYSNCSTNIGLSIDGGGGTWQGTMTQTDANHVTFVAECSNDLGQCQGQITNVTITGGTCAGASTLSFPVPDLAGGNQARYVVSCTGSNFTVTKNVYGSGYTSTPTPTFTCASCTGTQTVTVTWNSSSSGISTATGFQSFDISAGDPVAITNCVNTAFNTVGTTLHANVTYVPSGIGPPASYPSTPWNGTFATGNVTVTAPMVGTAGATETSHYCKLTTIQGAPFNLIWNHNTIVSSSTFVVVTGSAFNNTETDGPNFGANRAMLNSFMVGGTWGSSAISTGTVAQQFMDDTVNSFTADVLVWPGQSGMTAYGLNQFYPIGSPLFYYPTNSYCTGATPTTACIGFLGALSASSLPLNLADYHQYGLAAASAFIAGGSQDASDGTSVGVQSMSLLDNAQTANLFICGSTPCGSPGPFPDSDSTQAPVIPISRSGVMLSGLHFDPGMEPFHVRQ